MKNVLLTGANGQLGISIKQKLKQNYNVITTDIKGDVDILLDLRNINDIEKTVSKIYDNVSIDILINNAGIAVFTPTLERTFEEFDNVMKTNVYGTFFLTKEILKRMKQGKIINTASIYGLISPDKRIYGNSGRNSSEVYGMSKAAIIQLTKYIATHFKNIQCISISPGGIFNNQSEDFIKNYSEKTPLNRLADVEEISSLVEFLCSDSSSYINGENIVIDGGFSVW